MRLMATMSKRKGDLRLPYCQKLYIGELTFINSQNALNSIENNVFSMFFHFLGVFHFTLSFFWSVQSGRCRMAGLSPTNIFDASLSPLSCQSSHARATMANSPP